ncbi:MAG: hypothetical protein ACSHX7_11290 [Luteolibacter sp.]
MKYYNNLSDFVTAARDTSNQSIVANSATTNFSGRTKYADATNSRSPDNVRNEGVSAILEGHHVYAMVQFRPRLTTSGNVEDRKKNITLLADLVQAAKIIARRYDGALLEAQGSVVHIFLPDGTNSHKANEASIELQAYINSNLRKKAGDDFQKSLVAHSYGPTILVGSEDFHGDNSIVSLAPAANAPAKVLWMKWEEIPNGSILEVNLDGRYRMMEDSREEMLTEKVAAASVIVANSMQTINFSESRSSQRDFPSVDSPDSPTVDEPRKYFSISFRADIEGFTSSVASAFAKGEEAVRLLAAEFHQVMSHARNFCTTAECVHLPWAGDCFNLLLSFSERESYSDARERRILTVVLDFTRHMEKKFPNLRWAFSIAGGDLESAQSCNTLVSRISLGRSTLLLATGLPVQRSLQGLASESPDEDRGILWREDASHLDQDLLKILVKANGGENYRDFSRTDLETVQEEFDFRPSPAPYRSKIVPAAIAAKVPSIKGHFG